MMDGSMTDGDGLSQEPQPALWERVVLAAAVLAVGLFLMGAWGYETLKNWVKER